MPPAKAEFAGRARRLSRQHHHGLRQLPYAARRRRQADRREGLFAAASPSTTPAFIATAPNITPDMRNRNRKLERRRDQARAGRGIAPDMAVSPACRWPRSCRPISTRRCCLTISTPSSPICAAYKPVRERRWPTPCTRPPVRRDPYPDADAGFSKAMLADPVRRGAYLVTIGHCMECHSAWSRGVSDFKAGLGRGGRAFPPREGAPAGTRASIARQHHVASDRRHRRLDRPGNRPRHHPGHRPRRADAEAADGLWLLCGLKAADLADIVAYLRTVPP